MGERCPGPSHSSWLNKFELDLYKLGFQNRVQQRRAIFSLHRDRQLFQHTLVIEARFGACC